MARVIEGRVVDNHGTPVKGCSITRKGKTVAVTDSRGHFRLQTRAVEERIPVVFSAPGFVTTAKALHGRATFTGVIVVWPVAFRLRFDPTQALDVEFNGSRLKLPALSILDRKGKILSGPAELEFTFFDISDRRQLAAAPGDYSAITPEGKIQRLLSFGIFRIDLHSLDKKPLKLAPGTAFEISIPLPSKFRGAFRKKVGLYTMDSDNARWSLAGEFALDAVTGTYGGMVLPGDSCNLDEPVQTACKIPVVARYDQIRLEGIGVTATGVDPMNWMASSITDENGEACFSVPLFDSMGVYPATTLFVASGEDANGVKVQGSLSATSPSEAGECGDETCHRHYLIVEDVL